MPPTTREFAINASNHRYWDEPIRIYVDDCLKGADGPRGEDFNMRWIASMVAEAHRVLARGGIYMYPADVRDGYHRGRLRLVYEANPVAFLIEQAGGGASTGTRAHPRHCSRSRSTSACRCCSARATKWSGSTAITSSPYPIGERSPLFGRRGLFRELGAPCRSSHPIISSHRLLRRGHDVREARVRGHLPPREHHGRLHRRRRVPPLRPRARCARR